MCTRNGSKAWFQYKSMDLPLMRVNKPKTHSVLLQVDFVFVCLYKNLGFGVFKIKTVQIIKSQLSLHLIHNSLFSNLHHFPATFFSAVLALTLIFGS